MEQQVLCNNLELRALAHDLKKPFHQMVMAMNLFEHMRTDETLFKKVKNEITKQSLMVTSIIDDIIKAPNMSYQMAPESLPEVFDFCLSQIKRIYSDLEKDIEIKINYNHIGKPIINFYQFTRIIQNILHNAVEVLLDSNNIFKEIVIETKNIMINGKSHIEISLFNNGPTIEENDIKNIFDPYFTRKKIHGTGLGLASSKDIINKHSGYITCANKENNRGVEFIIRIPSSSYQSDMNNN